MAEKSGKHWLSNPSNVLSIIALIFSIYTFIHSEKRALEVEKVSSYNNLVNIIQKLAYLPKENLELFEKYKTKPQVASNLGAIITNENALLLNQAYFISNKIPELLTTSEYNFLATAFANNAQFDEAIDYYNKAIQKATSPNTALSAMQAKARLLFIMDNNQGRKSFQEAIYYLNKLKTDNKININLILNGLGYTESAWAQAEAEAGHFVEAKMQVDKAYSYFRQMPKNTTNEMTLKQLDELNVIIARNIKQ